MNIKDILHIINKKNIEYYLTNETAKELYNHIFLGKKYNSKKINIITDKCDFPFNLSDIFKVEQLGNSYQPYILSFKSYKINIFVRYGLSIVHKYFTYKNVYNIETFDRLFNRKIIDKNLYKLYKFHYIFNKKKLKLKK